MKEEKLDPDYEKALDTILRLLQKYYYWWGRCAAAEKFINAHPCDPDITEEQTKAWLEYQEYLKKEKLPE